MDDEMEVAFGFKAHSGWAAMVATEEIMSVHFRMHQTTQPNGPDSPPTCRQGSDHWDVP